MWCYYSSARKKKKWSKSVNAKLIWIQTGILFLWFILFFFFFFPFLLLFFYIYNLRRRQIFIALNKRENYRWELHSASTILASFASSLRWLILDVFSAKLMLRALFITDKKSFRKLWTTKHLFSAGLLGAFIIVI